MQKEEDASLRKKRKMECSRDYNLYLSPDILFEITKYCNSVKDYLNLSKVNKHFYESLMIKEENNLNNLFSKKEIMLKNYLPSSLFYLNNLNICFCNEEIFNTGFLTMFTKLKNLNISTLNHFDELQIEDLQNTNLEKLEISNFYKINGSGFKYLNNLKCLNISKMLNIDENTFKELPNLNIIELKISYNIVIGEWIKNFTKLKILKLQNIQFINNEEQFIGTLINLEEIDLNNCTFLNSFRFLQNLINLKIITISNNNFDKGVSITDEDIVNLKDLRKITFTTNVYSNNIIGTSFINLTNLEELNGNFNNLNEENLKYLINLKRLDLYNYNFLNGASFKYLKNLETLYCDSEFNENYLLDLPSLTFLDISFNEKFTGQYTFNLNNLRDLRASCTSLEDKYLMELKSLQHADLCDCKNITGECFLYLTNLLTLNIKNTNVDDKYLGHLINVKHLSIEKCTNIKNGQFLMQLNQLQSLQFTKGFIPMKILFKTKRERENLQLKIKQDQDLYSVLNSL
ncbi:hypothetical protein ABK040_005157 [Willaertia magna]